MARIGQRIQSSQRLTTGAGTAPQFSADTSVARAVVGLGNTVAGLQARNNQAEDRIARFKAAKDLETLGAQTDQQLLDGAGGIEPGGIGFAKSQNEAYKKNESAFLESVPEHLRPEFEVKTERLRGAVGLKTAKAELSERQRFYREGLDDTSQKLARNVETNPDGLKAARDNMRASVDQADLPTIEKKKRLEAYDQMLSAKAVEGLVGRGRANDARFLAAQTNGIGARFAQRVSGVEAGGNPNAKAKTSTALGLGQFIEQTWMGLVERQRPDLLANRSKAQVLELRKNGDLSLEMIGRLANENAANLSAKGLPVNDTTLYLAHFLGPAGASAVLKAPPGTSAAAVIDSAAVKANKSVLEGKTVDQVLAWANKKMSGPAGDGVAEPSFNALADAEKIIAGRGAQVKESIALGIEQGTVTTQEQITDSEFLDDGAKTTLLKQLRTREETVLNAQQAVVEYDAGGAFYDASNGKDKKKLDAIAEAKGADKESLLALDADAATIATEIAQRSGVVPPSVLATIRAQVSNGSDDARAYGLSLMDRIHRVSPDVARRDFRKADLDKMVQYRTLIEAGRTQEDALEAVKAQSDPMQGAVRKQLREEGQKLAEDIDIGDVADVFDPSVFFPGANAPEDEVRKRRLVETYRELYADSFEKHGDADLAKQQADVSIKKTFGPSKINGTGALGQGQIMRLPPEAHYPAVDQDNPHEWMKPQLRRDVMKIMNISEPKAETVTSRRQGTFTKAPSASLNIRVVPDTRTAEDVSAGRPPSYTIMVERDGVLDIVRDNQNQPLRYRFDAQGATDKFRKKELERAKKAREEYLRTRGEGRKEHSSGIEIKRF